MISIACDCDTFSSYRLKRDKILQMGENEPWPLLMQLTSNSCNVALSSPKRNCRHDLCDCIENRKRGESAHQRIRWRSIKEIQNNTRIVALRVSA